MNHEYYMREALDLSRKGWPSVVPNPLVGAVIVRNDKIVASGYHQHFGQAHAEVNAIAALPDTIPASECTLYVTLEPCSHHGKTPPCADLIISKGFKAVVIACKDPNPLVAGKGIKKLKAAGIQVLTDILAQEARQLNKRFVAFYEKKRPYYVLKWAMTADGFISKSPVPANRQDNLISGVEARDYVHRLRAENTGILVGKDTVLNDNPRLTTRFASGKNPVRLFIDKQLQVPGHFHVYNNEAETLVFNSLRDDQTDHTSYIKLNFEKDILAQISEKLYQRNIQSVLVEGGAFLLNTFIKQNLWDEVIIFQNPDLRFETGVKGPEFPIKNSFELIGNDKLFYYTKNEPNDPSLALKTEIF